MATAVAGSEHTMLAIDVGSNACCVPSATSKDTAVSKDVIVVFILADCGIAGQLEPKWLQASMHGARHGERHK